MNSSVLHFLSMFLEQDFHYSVLSNYLVFCCIFHLLHYYFNILSILLIARIPTVIWIGVLLLVIICIQLLF